MIFFHGRKVLSCFINESHRHKHTQTQKVPSLKIVQDKSLQGMADVFSTRDLCLTPKLISYYLLALSILYSSHTKLLAVHHMPHILSLFMSIRQYSQDMHGLALPIFWTTQASHHSCTIHRGHPFPIPKLTRFLSLLLSWSEIVFSPLFT